MRLLKLRFTNINSLAGTWEIDFTHADFKRSPLFAIIGPTGAGKSTILDAVSLALYATTPRLRDATSKLEGDDACPVLTKGEKMTEARVRFESDGVEYLSRWSRRTKRTGKLSDDEVELIRYARPDDEEGEVIATKKTDWTKKIQEVTHMTFEIFTRSVLLAQGAFANFLKASEDERANLLEKITGTDIYTEISKRVFERTKVENERLKEQQTRLEGMQLLDDATRETLTHTLTALQQTLPGLKAQAQTLEATYRWRQHLDALTEAVAQQEKAVSDAQSALHAFDPQSRRATLGRQAARPYHDHQVLTATLDKEAKAQTHLKQLDEELAKITTNYPTWQADATTATESLKKANADRQAFEPDYQAMLQIDERLTALMKTVKTLSQEETNAKTQLEASIDAHTKTQTAYQTLEATVAQLKAEAQKSAGDELLEGPLALLNRARDNLEQLRHQYLLEQKAKQKSESAVATLTEALATLNTKIEELKTTHATCQHATLEADQALNALSAGNSYASTLERMRTLSDEIAQARHLQKYLALEATVKRSDNALQEAVTDPTVLAWWHATGTTQVESIKAQIKEAIDAIEAEYPGLTVLMQTDANKHLAHLTSTQASLATWTNTFAKAQATLRQAQDAERKAKNELDRQQAAYNAKALELEKENGVVKAKAERLADFVNASVKEKEDIKAACAKIPACPDLELTTLCQHLTDRLENRKRLMETLDQNERALANQKATLAQYETALKNAKTQLAKVSTELANEKKTKDEVQNDRLTRFGRTKPNEKRVVLDAAIQEANEKLQTAQTVLQKADTQIASLKAKMETTTQTLTALSEEVATQRTTFETSLATSGFADWMSVTAAYLPENDIEAIEREAEKLRLAHATAQGALKKTKEDQTQEAAKALSALTTDALKTEWETATQAHDDAKRQEIETASQLQADNQRRQQVASAQREMEAQKAIADQWTALNSMIGSHDGKRFRTAAQKVTFRVLLKLANDAMKTMTSRYQLLTGTQSGLALNVLDKDMGSIVRTSQNLSGGETFIVSLSLALGLSRMGGEHLRVDTLFLDEGFGTLDEQTLDKALYALETLQKSSGKLIGLISHVKSIRDRIDAQIVVTGRPGSGRSVLSGPGVRKLEAA